MIRVGGPGGAGLPPSDPAVERQMANAAVAGNALVFGAIVFALNLAPHILSQMGFDSVLI